MTNEPADLTAHLPDVRTGAGGGLHLNGIDRREVVALIQSRSWVIGACLLIQAQALAQMQAEEPSADTREEFSRVEKRLSESFRYGERGLEFEPPNGETSLWLGLRFQTRLDSRPGDLTSAESLRQDVDTTLKLKRGRIKGGGTLFRDWFTVYSEYDFTSSTWLDYRATTTIGGWLSFRIGQWKSEFNRERVDSSGKQQLAERSIANYWFTIDRQRALAASARFGQGSRADTRIWVEALTGHGRGGSYESGDGLLLARAQWNPAGEQLPFSQSDLKRRDRPIPSLAVAHIRGDTPFTRFSSSGGGQLPGFNRGDYRLRQWLIETALHYRGLSWQQELHFKRIDDRRSGGKTDLVGGYAQLGSFFNEWWPSVPSALELVGRFSMVDVDRDMPANDQKEWTLGANWFFQGHRNKLTLDLSRLDFADPEQGGREKSTRVRLQWELSL